MSISAYRRFSKTIQRITVLYEVTIDSYRIMYDAGRERLKHDGVKNAMHEIKLEDNKVRKRSLRKMTFHAKDVYPQILRSTLLIRLVATYEAYLTDALRELSHRSRDFLKSEHHLDLSQERLLALVADEGIEAFVLNRTLRSLSSGGYKEIVKFYKKMVGVDVPPPGVALKDMVEVHDRRHLYVHGGGLADEQYCRSYPGVGAEPGVLVPVAEAYLLKVIQLLEDSAKHVHNQLTAKFPESSWIYVKGTQQMADSLVHLHLYSGKVNGGNPLDLTAVLPGGAIRLEEVTVWVGRRDKEFKLLVGGDAEQARMYSKYIYLEEMNGTLGNVISEKLAR